MQPASHTPSHWLALLDDYEKSEARIAQKLHNELGQEIVVLSLGLKALEATTSSEKKSEILDELRRTIDLIGRQVHSLSLDLHPASLDAHGLAKALAHYVSNWGRQTGIDATFHDDQREFGRLQPRLEAAAYRLTQEALSNIAQHARATSVNVTLTRINAQLRLVIEDDGRGFDSCQVFDANQRGLTRMCDLMRTVNAEFILESRPDAGCTVTAQLPIS